MDRSATFDETGAYRYQLGRRWDDYNLRNLCFIMLNPSTADAFEEDPTIRRCIGFAKRFGFPSLTVVNLFAMRATDPKELKHAMDPVGERNDQYICDAVTNSTKVVCAWGVHGAMRDRNQEVLKLITELPRELRHFGLTKEGHPKHPLYLPKEAKLYEFGVDVAEGGESDA